MIGNINQGCDIEVDLIDGNDIESSNSRVVQADVVYDVNYAIGQNILLAVIAIAGF